MIREMLQIPVHHAIDRALDSIIKRINGKETHNTYIQEHEKSEEEQLREGIKELERLAKSHE